MTTAQHDQKATILTGGRRPRPLFDLGGNHLQQHGGTVYSHTPSLPGEVPTPVTVYSRYGLGTKQRAKVCMQAASGPFVLTLMTNPAAARQLAAALTLAADRADEVQAMLDRTVRVGGVPV